MLEDEEEGEEQEPGAIDEALVCADASYSTEYPP
jgi:hypothetical protein